MDLPDNYYIDLNYSKEEAKEFNETSYMVKGHSYNSSMFGEIGRVNIFVGANNSGKSRFLRGLTRTNKLLTHNSINPMFFEDKDFLLRKSAPIKVILGFKHAQHLYDHISNNADYSFEFNHRFEDAYEFNAQSLNVIFNDLKNSVLGRSDYSKFLFFSEQLRYYRYIVKFYSTYQNETNHYIHSQMTNAVTNLNIVTHQNNKEDRAEHLALVEKIESILVRVATIYKPQKVDLSADLGVKKTYIPIWRSLITFSNTDVFRQKVKIHYGIENRGNVLVHTGQSLYNQIYRLVNNKERSERVKLSFFQEFLSRVFFDGEPIEITATVDEDNTLTNIITICFVKRNVEREIFHFGDGIQSIINLSFPIFTANNNEWFFIEEPELNLHPTYQRIFIEEILNNKEIKKKKLKFFFTSHSNHLLDISIENNNDVSIFTFKEIGDKPGKLFHEIRNVSSSDNDILKLLGVNNSSIFMTNCCIWVEGITERLFIKSFLLSYAKEHEVTVYKEGIHFSFFEYAGSNIAHYYFDEEDQFDLIKAKRLSNKIFLLADNDNDTKSKRHKDLSEQFNEETSSEYKRLDCREMENILTIEQIKEILSTWNFKKNKVKIKKGIEELSITQAELKSEYLGSLLFEKIQGLPNSFVAESGTLGSSMKKLFRDEMSKGVSWKEMSNEAKELTENLYGFIKNSQF